MLTHNTSLFYRGNISQYDANQFFKKYYETGLDYAKLHIHKKPRKRSQEDNKDKEKKENIETLSFSDGFENMPLNFAEWNVKGRNFKICEQSVYDHLEATSVSTTSKIHSYVENIYNMYNSMFSKRYCC